MPSRARKVLAAAQARTKKGGSRDAHKGASRGLHAEASLTFAVMNPSCEETSICSFSLGTGKNMILFLISAKKMFELISRFCRSCGSEVFL